MRESRVATRWELRGDSSHVEVLQHKDLQDLAEVLDGGTVEVLLVVVEGVPHGGERRGDQVKHTHT